MTNMQYSLANSHDLEESAPPTSYRDDPSESSPQTNENGNGVQPQVHPYRDDPTDTEGSVFDWGSSSDNPVVGVESVSLEEMAQNTQNGSGALDTSMETNCPPIKMKVSKTTATPRRDSVSFAPLSLDDEDEEDLQHFSRSRNHSSEGYLRAGGRSNNKCYMMNRICFCHRWVLLPLAFLCVMIGFGFLGYEAGQPAKHKENEPTITKGQEWLEWIEHSKDHVHWPHIHHDAASKSSNTEIFVPQTQSQLLQTSNLIFHSCNEYSLSTSSGRNACLSACHGRICCFEKEKRYGSCIDTPYSYCYVYAACENALADFEMSNTNLVTTNNNGRLNEQDQAFLANACSAQNIESLEGIRDCNAFCMHHLCCFNGEGCGSIMTGVCGDYNACKVLVKNVVKTIGPTGGGGTMVRPEPTNIANGHDFAYHDLDAIRSSISAACTFDPLADDDSWVPGCHELCADHLCCFGTPGTTSDCREEKNKMCNAYASCNVLMYQSKDINHEEIKSKYVPHRPEIQPWSSTMPDDIREVNEACNDNVLQNTELKDRCEAACSSRKCCFTNGPGNCYILVSVATPSFLALHCHKNIYMIRYYLNSLLFITIGFISMFVGYSMV